MMVRPATPHDAEAICAIWNPIIRDTTVTFTTTQKSVHGISKEISESAAAGDGWIVVEHESAVAGFASYGTFRPGPGYAHVAEHTVHVAPTSHGEGIGRLLVTSLAKQARRRGIEWLIGGVSGENRSAIAFHRALGFAEVGRLPGVGWKFGRALDLLFFQKSTDFAA